MKTKFTF